MNDENWTKQTVSVPTWLIAAGLTVIIVSLAAATVDAPDAPTVDTPDPSRIERAARWLAR